MQAGKTDSQDLYYTHDHEWIDFHGSLAYIGVCGFKLSGFKEIHKIHFNNPSGFKKKGEIIASVTYKDYQIEIHMPVDGRLMQFNEILLSVERNTLLQNPENKGWIALIVPSSPGERTDLLLPHQYRMKSKINYVK